MADEAWAFGLLVVLSLVQLEIAVAANDFTSFIAIRGVIVLVYLLRNRRYFHI